MHCCDVPKPFLEMLLSEIILILVQRSCEHFERKEGDISSFLVVFAFVPLKDVFLLLGQ